MSSAVVYFKGMPSRFTKRQLDLASDVHWTGKEYEYGVDPILGRVELGEASSGRAEFVFWGDSHGLAAFETIDQIASDFGSKGIAFLSAGRAPVTGLWKPAKGPAEEENAVIANQRILDYILEKKIKNLVLMARWSGMCEGRNESEIEEFPSKPANFPMVANKHGANLTSDASSLALRDQISKMLVTMNAAGIKVWLFLQVPENDNCDTAKEFYLSQMFPNLNSMRMESPSFQEHKDRQSSANEILLSLDAENLAIITPAQEFFRNDGHLDTFSSRSHYRDDDHLTRFGARKFLSSSLEQVFDQIRKRTEIHKEK